MTFDPWKQSKINSGIAKLKEYKPQNQDIDSIDDLKRLAGVNSTNSIQQQSITTADKARYERENNIKRGSPEWFKLWFAQPGLTGESPFSK